MTRTLTMKLLLFCCLVLVNLQTKAQGWEKKYSPDAIMAINMIYPTPGGSYLVTGWNLSSPNVFQRVMKMDAQGEVMWKSDIDSIIDPGAASVTQDGGLIMIARGPSNSGTGNNYSNIVRVDSNGHKLWLQTLHPLNSTSSNSGNMGLDTTDNGGFVALFTTYDTVALHYGLYIDRLDADGNIIWQHSYYTGDTLPIGYNISNSKDGGFIVTAGANSQASLYLFKVDGNGNLLWQYQPALAQHWLSATIRKDGNIYVLSTTLGGGNNAISTLNQAGQVLWTQAYNLPGGAGWGWYGNVIEKTSNQLALMVTGYDTITVLNNPTRVLAYRLAIVDTSGNILSYKDIPTANLGSNISLLLTGGECFQQTPDKGYITGGWVQYDPNNYSAYLIKMDSDAVVYPSALSGYIYGDNNNNCNRDSSEIFLSPVNVVLTSPRDTFSVITVDSGYYALGLDTGNYQIKVLPPSPYWQASSCNTTTINLPAGTDSSVSLALTPVVYSPYIAINGHMSRQRLCNAATYTVQYCNTGTAPFTGVIVITIDSLLQVDSTSVTPITQTGQQYYFSVADLGVMQCASFEIYCSLPCNTSLIGRTTCINAQAFQDTIVSASPLWDRSNLNMAVDYNPGTDTITFTLKNKGTGNMSSPKGLIVIEDNVILMNIPVQLNSGTQYLQRIKANGATWRASVPQTDYNPYSKFATAAIEGVGTNQQGGISTGYFTQFPYNGYTGYEYNTCTEIFSAVDPNEKTVTPKGEGPDHIIDSTVSLEYTIDFQNTGNDTAFTVRIVDTLATYLDPATVRLEVSSAPCQVTLSGKNVLIFTFNHINLPDSGASQMRSTGFVKFGISQKPGNPTGSVINNNAGIYFDYNQPVVTNTATVKIGRLLLTGIESTYPEKQLQINAYPNPFSSFTVIKIDGETFDNLQLNVYDLTGRLVKQQVARNTNQFLLYRADLAGGNYIFEITGNGKPVGRGKIVAQ